MLTCIILAPIDYQYQNFISPQTLMLQDLLRCIVNMQFPLGVYLHNKDGQSRLSRSYHKLVNAICFTIKSELQRLDAGNSVTVNSKSLASWWQIKWSAFILYWKYVMLTNELLTPANSFEDCLQEKIYFCSWWPVISRNSYRHIENKYCSSTDLWYYAW